MKLYEGMFLIEAGRAARDWEGSENDIVTILEKHGAGIRERDRFDERKLAFPVKGARRGAYLLAYFDADPAALEEMRRDLSLSETVLRSMILRIDDDRVPESRSLGSMEPMSPVAPQDDDGEPEDSPAVDASDDDDEAEGEKIEARKPAAETDEAEGKEA